jgi:hypothetical protein
MNDSVEYLPPATRNKILGKCMEERNAGSMVVVTDGTVSSHISFHSRDMVLQRIILSRI